MRIYRLKQTGLLCAASFLFLATGAQAQHYTQTNLVSNQAGAAQKDPNLVNAWGLSRASGSPWWISDNGTGMTTLYDGKGNIQSLVVAVTGDSPTGTVFNGTGDFALPNGKPALFLFATESGVISGWAPGAMSTTVVVNNPGSVYKGLAIASFGGHNYLYAADFHNGRIDVFDSKFQSLKVTMPGITDTWFRNFPGSGSGFAPFNIQNIGGSLIVAIALPNGERHDNVNGAGLGQIVSFTPQGQLIRVFEHGDWLNAPWGLALAPGDFGAFSHKLLVGNFGSGNIAAYNIETGKYEGLMWDPNGKPTWIDGLWGLSFGGGDDKSGPANSLYFTAGPNYEGDGLFGTLTAVDGDQTLGNGN